MAKRAGSVPPKSVKLGYREIEIGSADLEWELKNRKCHGVFDRVKKEITYSKRLNDTPPELLNTIIHELVHAVLNMSGMEHIPDNQEESIVVAVSNGFTELCIRNPDLVDWVSEISKAAREE